MKELGEREGAIGDTSSRREAEKKACDDAVYAEQKKQGEDGYENVVAVLGEIRAEYAGCDAGDAHLGLEESGEVCGEAGRVDDGDYAGFGDELEVGVGCVWGELDEAHRDHEGGKDDIGGVGGICATEAAGGRRQEAGGSAKVGFEGRSRQAVEVGDEEMKDKGKPFWDTPVCLTMTSSRLKGFVPPSSQDLQRIEFSRSSTNGMHGRDV